MTQLGLAWRVGVATLLLLQGCRPKQAAIPVEVHSLAREFCGLLKLGAVSRATALFYYPPDYTAEERKQDETGVARMLALLLEDFGRPEVSSLLPNLPARWEVGAGGGSVAFWSKRPSFGRDLSLAYRAEFAKLGSGYVVVHAMWTGDSWQLQSASFALAADRPGTREIVQDIARKMREMLEQERKPPVKALATRGHGPMPGTSLDAPGAAIVAFRAEPQEASTGECRPPVAAELDGTGTFLALCLRLASPRAGVHDQSTVRQL